MCGIASAFTFGDTTQEQKKAIRFILSESLLLTEKLGEDATGLAWLYNDGWWNLIKKAEESSKWLLTDAEVSSVWEKSELRTPSIRSILGHCRKSTIGTEYYPYNNHPFAISDKNTTLGVHNGTVENYQKISQLHNFASRKGEVDSEVLVLLGAYAIAKYGLSEQACEYVAQRIEGNNAFILINDADPTKVLLYRDSKPLHFSICPELNAVFIHTDKDATTNAIFRYNSAIKFGLMNAILTKPTTGIVTHARAMCMDLSRGIPNKDIDEISTGAVVSGTLEAYKTKKIVSSIGYGGWESNQVRRSQCASPYLPQVTTKPETETKTKLTSVQENDLWDEDYDMAVLANKIMDMSYEHADNVTKENSITEALVQRTASILMTEFNTGTRTKLAAELKVSEKTLENMKLEEILPGIVLLVLRKHLTQLSNVGCEVLASD